MSDAFSSVVHIDPLTQEDLFRLLRGQAASADVWINQHYRYNDARSKLNAVFALGKYFGLYNALLSMTAGEEDFPEEVLQTSKRFSAIFDTL